MHETVVALQSIDSGRNAVIDDREELERILESLPDDELMYCVIPLHWISQPDLMPTDYKTLVTIKGQIVSALGEPGTVNGIRDPLWLVCVNGELRIANGYHRYEALDQLASDDSGFSQNVFVRIENGEPDKLWKMMLEGAGNHRTVAPARFVRFMRDYWNETDIGRQVSLADAISYIGQDRSAR
ncbi:MAG: hypothetical protein U9Q67_01865 [Patescibacteria group bacterium]|nr:hypothetical protein [Patescibacteria group bacterium]